MIYILTAGFILLLTITAVAMTIYINSEKNKTAIEKKQDHTLRNMKLTQSLINHLQFLLTEETVNVKKVEELEKQILDTIKNEK